jgi:regulator of cell morphogenesis and NO signaling
LINAKNKAEEKYYFMNTTQLTKAVGSSATKDYTKPPFNLCLDFCCNDDKMPSEDSLSAGVIKEKMITALHQIHLKRPTSSEFDKWKLDSMIEYIINTHHQYAKANAVTIYDLAQKVAHHHSKNHPELMQLTTAMFLFLHDLLNCMVKEEQILFPNIKHLVKNKSHSGKSRYTTFGLIKEWVRLIRKGHQASIKYINLCHELTNDYMLPKDACHSYRCLFEKMKEYEDDLLIHLHLENNILFPKAIVEDEEFGENAFVNTKCRK